MDNLGDIAKDLDMRLTSEDEFDLTYLTFQTNYLDCNAAEMPDEDSNGGPYSEYMALEDIYVRNVNPSQLQQAQMDALRDTMQRYAEFHRD